MAWQQPGNMLTEALDWQQLIFLQIRDIEKLRYTNKVACVEAIKGLESLMNEKLEKSEAIKNNVLEIKQRMNKAIKELPEKNRKDSQYMAVFTAEYYNLVYLEIVKLVGWHYSPLSRVQQIIDNNDLKKKLSPQPTNSLDTSTDAPTNIINLGCK